jgi:hypothetical protein
MKLNHPPVIQWNDPTASISMISQSGHTLDKAPDGASFTLRFRQPSDGYIMVEWEVESADHSIFEEGSITIAYKDDGMMGEAIDYDGAFELPHQLNDRLMALGYCTKDITA